MESYARAGMNPNIGIRYSPFGDVSKGGTVSVGAPPKLKGAKGGSPEQYPGLARAVAISRQAAGIRGVVVVRKGNKLVRMPAKAAAQMQKATAPRARAPAGPVQF